jgi:hypothetical protein
MADFYRRTRVEELGLAHPGLLEFVEQASRDRMPFPQIAAAIREQYEEEISPQTLSNHYLLRIWKKKDAEIKSYTDALGQGRALLELQKENPTAERQDLIEAFVDVGIITQKQRLMESDPLKLMAERRRRAEGQGRFKIETGKLEIEQKRLELDAQRLEKENRELQLKIDRYRQTMEEVTDEASQQIASGKPVTLEDINRIRERVFGLPPHPAAGDPNLPVPTTVGG